MIRLTLNSHVIKLYDSIDEMPIVNFQKYNKYLLIDSGIGSNVDDYNEHITRIIQYIKANKKEELTKELTNTRQLLYMINSGISPKYLAFAALIAEFDGKKVYDLSDDNLKNILSQLREVKHGWLIRKLQEIKKKVSAELELYFPKMFGGSAKEKEAFGRLKERTILELEGIITGVKKADKIEEIDQYLLGLSKPKTFIGPGSVEIKYDKSFENISIAIKSKLGLDVKELSVMQYYNAVETLNKMAEESKSTFKKGKLKG